VIRRNHALRLRRPFAIIPAGEHPSRFDTPANCPLRSSSRLTILQIRRFIERTTDTPARSSRRAICSDVPPLHPATVLTSLESALTEKAPVTPLQSALPKSLDLKPFRIRTYEKRRGEGGYPKTPNPPLSSKASSAHFRLSTVDCRLSLEFTLEMGCIESGAWWHSRLRCAKRPAQDFYA
jgi:hypothetical protein